MRQTFLPMTAATVIIMSSCAALRAGADSVVQTLAGEMAISRVVSGLDEPWGLEFLPDGGFLVTERDRVRLRLYSASGAEMGDIAGLPDVQAGGQGGLLDVMVPRNFAADPAGNSWVYLTYATQIAGGGVGTALARGRLEAGAMALRDVQVVFSAPQGEDGGRHFGARVIEAADGTLYLALGDRGTGPEGMQSQDPSRAEGKVFHLNPDGTPATVQAGALPGMFTLGHRNPQGLVQTAGGDVIVVEHGPQGGDEVNILQRGANYGWPLVSLGEEYGGGTIGVAQMDGMTDGVHVWTPSIAPSGLMEYQGDLIRGWRGDLLTGSLNSDYISRLDAQGGWAEERISAQETARVRDVAQAPDGSIWFLSVADGAVYRLAPIGK